MAAPAKINWFEARNDYIADASLSYADIAKKYGVTKTGVQKRGTKEGWPELRQSYADKAFDQFQEKLLDQKSKAQSDHLVSYQNMRAIVNRQIMQIAEQRVPEYDKKGNIVLDLKGKPLFREPEAGELKLLSQALHNAIAGERIVLGLPSSVAGLSNAEGDSVWAGFSELAKAAQKVVSDNGASTSPKNTDDPASNSN